MDTSRDERNAVLAIEISRLSGYLQRYARTRVRDEHLVEDAVQETMLAALESLDSFDGRATLRTWLTGILLHKIHDGFRRGARDGDPGIGEAGEPVEWLTPDHALHVKRMCGAFAQAVEALPKRQAEAFLLGEIEEIESERLCRKLGVSRGNLWVLLHRARTALRADLGRRGYSIA
jgi:RNA polymerase sigma-70 factor (ECF subfamily)